MIDYEYQELFLKDSIDKQIHIVSDEYTILENGMKKPLIDITNKELHQEIFELTENLCSENELIFGSCEASMIKFTVSNTFLPMKDKWLTVTIAIKGEKDRDETFQIGRYKVYSDELSADRTCRDITAYDAMYDIINSDVIDWYNSVFPLVQKGSVQIGKEGNTNIKNTYQTVTMRQFRKSFIEHFGLEESEIDVLINDDMIIEKTIEVESGEEENSRTESKNVIKESSLSGAAVIQAICEINGCFGHIGRDGKFHYIYLEQDIQGLYPSNELFPDHAPDYLLQSKTHHLYPQNPKSTNIGKSFYITANYEEYHVKGIDKLQIRKEENDIGSVVGEGKNCYVIENNFLVYGKNAAELERICTNIYNKIKNIIYRPFSADCKGNPCLEIGDSIRISTKYDLIETYILERTLKGIQSLRDTFSAKGEEYRSENVNSVNKSIIQLKGKTNTLIRNVEETNSHIDDVEKGLSSEIKQTAEQIKSTVAKENTKWDTIGYTIEISSYGEPSSIVDDTGSLTYQPQKYRYKYYLDQETGYLYQSDGTSWIKCRELQKATETLKTSIEQTANSITSTIAAATSKYDTEDYIINYYGYGAPGEELKNASQGSKYLDQSNGAYYLKTEAEYWAYAKTFKLITSQLSSRIEQKVDSIILETYKGDISAALELKINKGDGSEVVSAINGSADKIQFKANNMFTVDSPNFKIDNSGNVAITGEIKANSGNIGNFTINKEQGWMQYDTNVNNEVCGLGARAAFYAGNREDSLEAPFYVTYDGFLHAEGGTIGNFTIDKTNGWMEYKKGDNEVCGLGANAALYAGSDDSLNAPFHVTYGGLLYAQGGKIGNFTIDPHFGWMEYNKGGNQVCGIGANAALYAGSGDSNNAPFHVTYNGHLHAENADISGTINASSGTIAGWNVTENSLEKGDSILSPNELKIVKAGVAEKLVIDFSVPGQARIDVGTGGVITLNGIDFTYNDLYRLKTEILGGKIEDNKSISAQRVEKKGEQNEQDI